VLLAGCRATLPGFGSACSPAPGPLSSPSNVSSARRFGLRPFRPSGRVRQRRNWTAKTVVHTMARRAAGMTLSPGNVAIGDGEAAGSAAREIRGDRDAGWWGLSRRGWRSSRHGGTIYTKAMPAGDPPTWRAGCGNRCRLFDGPRVSRSSGRQFAGHRRLAWRRYQVGWRASTSVKLLAPYTFRRMNTRHRCR